jgi:hypothetical protein
MGWDGWRNVKPDMDEMRTLWKQHGRTITADVAQEHPGERPWAWWELSAPEPRRRFGGDALLSGGLVYGEPRCIGGPDDGTPNGKPTGIPGPTLFETAPAYLLRHGLLRRSELRALGDDWPAAHSKGGDGSRCLLRGPAGVEIADAAYRAGEALPAEWWEPGEHVGAPFRKFVRATVGGPAIEEGGNVTAIGGKR